MRSGWKKKCLCVAQPPTLFSDFASYNNVCYEAAHLLGYVLECPFLNYTVALRSESRRTASNPIHCAPWLYQLACDGAILNGKSNRCVQQSDKESDNGVTDEGSAAGDGGRHHGQAVDHRHSQRQVRASGEAKKSATTPHALEVFRSLSVEHSMIAASQLKKGMALRIDGQVDKVLEAEFKAGAGKMGGVVKAKLRNTGSGRL
jgi:hypothetical protein